MIKVGNIVPITLQMTDGNENLEIMCRIFDPAGLIITTLNLSHVKAGLYANLDFKMPPYNFIVCQYLVLGTDDYEDVTETFYADEIPTEKEIILTGVIVDVKTDDFLEGQINETENH